jgi:hypothetical protein
MKVAEYTALLSTTPIAKIADLFIDEFSNIKKSRNAHTSGAVAAIIHELHLKWRALSQNTNIPPNYFLNHLKGARPELYALYKRDLNRTRNRTQT